MPAKKTHEQFVNEVFELVGSEYTLLTRYTYSNAKVKLKHEKCGQEINMTPNNFLRGQRCVYCYKKNLSESRRFSHEEYVNKVERKYGDEYSILSRYKKAREKVLVRHNVCGNEYEQTAHSLLKGLGCYSCGEKKKAESKKLSQEEVKKRIEKKFGNEYEVIGKYKSMKEKVDVRHNECGSVYQVRIYALLKEDGVCPVCGEKRRRESRTKPKEEFEKELERLTKGEYLLTSEYINRKTKVELIHKTCATKYKVAPQKFLSGRRCPYCFSSHGEKLIEETLKRFKFDYKRQYVLKECKHKQPLRFDFCVFDGDDILALIEYDGEQHYRPVSLFGGEEGYQKTKRRDRSKNEYCLSNRLPLIRIPYYITNIEDHLMREMNNIDAKTLAN